MIMKDSGVEWLGDIPAHWKICRLKNLATQPKTIFTDGDWIESKDLSESGINYFTTGNIGDGFFKDKDFSYISFEKFEELKCTMIKAGDLIFSRLNLPMGRACIIPEQYHQSVIAVDNVLLRPNNFIEKKYIVYLTMCQGYQYFNSLLSRGTTMQRMSHSQLGNIKIPLPPLEEQKKISAYLDKKCAAIDSAVDAAKKLVVKFGEYKKALITETVTKGLNRAAKMKDSGVEWLGDIPAHWKICRLKNFGTCRNGLTYSPNDIVDEDKGILVLRSSNIKSGKLFFGDNVFVKNADDTFKVKKGDILICSRNGSRELIGKNAIIDRDIEAYFGAFMLIYRCENPKYIYHVLNSNIFSYYLGTFFTSTINQLTIKNFTNIKIPLPPLEEQKKISAYLDKKCAAIDENIEKHRQLAEKLTEYKKSLIYEVVTGKMEV